MSVVRLTSYRWVPSFAQGLVRDLPVRWALEEAGIGYREKLLPLEERNSTDHLESQPFGQVPVYEEGNLTLFESGAIVMHIGERSPVLLPTDPGRRARAITWMFAALNSVEPHVQNLTTMDLFFSSEDWAKQRRPGVEQMVRARLQAVATALGSSDYLEGEFTAGDLMMSCVLRFLRHTSMVADMPALATYLARCEARPAFHRALAAQMASFAQYAPAA